MQKHLKNYQFQWILMVAVFILAGCVNGLVLTTPPNLKQAMDSIEKLKLQAEDRVKLVNNEVQQGKMNATDLQTVKNSYEVTRSAFSDWINSVQSDLKIKKFGSAPVDYKALSQDATNKAQQFNALVDGLLKTSTRGDEVETIKSFLKAGSELQNTLNEIDHSKRDELIKKLEDLRLSSWEIIK